MAEQGPEAVNGAQNQHIADPSSGHFKHEGSESSGKLIIAGSMRDISPNARWKGSVSVDERIRSGELTEADITKNFERVNGLYVPVKRGSALRCGDERGDEEKDDGLGPQLLGAGAALAVTIWMYKMSTDPSYSGTIEDEIPEAIELAYEIGHAPGGHGDTIAGKAGCGDSKTKEEQTSLVIAGDPGFEDVTRAYMEADFSEENHGRIVRSLREFVTARGLIIPSAETMAEAMQEANPEGFRTKVGPHQGVGVVKNKQEGYTLDINRLDKETNSLLNVFNIDAWLDANIAKAMSTDPERQSIVKNIRGIQTIATSMILLDGSLRFAIRNEG